MNTATLFSPDLMAFNLLPSRTLHASRLPLFLKDDALVQPPAEWRPAWHRHCSRLILERLGLTERLVTDTGSPQLRLALLPASRLHLCLSRIGATLCGPRLRRAIRGVEVRAILASAGEPLMRFACEDAMAVHAGLQETIDWPLDETLAAIEPLGAAALMSAFREAGEALALRAELKLPLVPDVASPLAGDRALNLAMNVLDMAASS